MTDASSDVGANDMEEGSEAAGTFANSLAEINDSMWGARTPAQIAKDYQAPEPDGPYNDGPGHPSSDPLTGQVQSLVPHLPNQHSVPTAFDEAIASITPPDIDTVLRPPTLTSGEIGGRLTEGDDPSSL